MATFPIFKTANRKMFTLVALFQLKKKQPWKKVVSKNKMVKVEGGE
jgi:hypothetical protein